MIECILPDQSIRVIFDEDQSIGDVGPGDYRRIGAPPIPQAPVQGSVEQALVAWGVPVGTSTAYKLQYV